MNDAVSSKDRRLDVLAWTLAIVPALVLLLYVAVYTVNGPEWDHVNSAEIFDRWDRGEFTLEYLFRQHNEHRKAAPRLAILALGKLTRWDNRPEAFAHLALMAGTALILFAAFRRDTGLTEARCRPLLFFAPIACLLASQRSYDALLGDGFPHYLSIIGFAGALCTLAFARPSAGALAGAIACGLLASFSISNGLLVWPIGLLILLCDARVDPPRGFTWTRAAVWGAAGAITIAAYFHGYRDPGNHSSPRFLLEHPSIGLEHFLAVNGSSLAPDLHGALVFGAIILLLDLVFLVLVLDDWWRRRQRPPFGAWLIVTVLVSGMMITMNRAGFGADQALASRYTGISVLAPIGLYWIAVAARDRWRLARPMKVSLATLMLVGYLAASVDAWAIAPEWYSRKSWMAYLMYSAKYQPSSLLEKLYPNPDHARVYSAAMERLGYNVFADPHLRPETLVVGNTRPDYAVETVNGQPAGAGTKIEVGADDAVVVEGWAFNDTSTGPARAVFLTIDGTRDLPAHVGIYRPGLGGGIRRRDRRWAGFTGSFGGFVLEPGEHTLTVKIASDDGMRAFVTRPVARIVRR
jgi:hypothetical protein